MDEIKIVVIVVAAVFILPCVIWVGARIVWKSMFKSFFEEFENYKKKQKEKENQNGV